VTFPNRDTYFGGYSGGAKCGLGLYAFATGAAYLGQYKEVRSRASGWHGQPASALHALAGGATTGRHELGRGRRKQVLLLATVAAAQGKRHGQGWMILPDGGFYQGAFEGGQQLAAPDQLRAAGAQDAAEAHRPQ
jgi:hypothetical protein